MILAMLAAALAVAPAASPEKIVEQPAPKVFAFLSEYYRLPAADRSRFGLTYRVQLKTGGLGGGLRLVDGGAEAPVPSSPDGWVTRPPAQAVLARARVKVVVPSGAPASVIMVPEATLGRFDSIEVADLRAAADQLAALRRKTGPLALLIPQFTRVVFPDAEGGVAVDGQGRETPLTRTPRGSVVLDLADGRDVRRVRFAKAPFHALLAPAAAHGAKER